MVQYTSNFPLSTFRYLCLLILACRSFASSLLATLWRFLCSPLNLHILMDSSDIIERVPTPIPPNDLRSYHTNHDNGKPSEYDIKRERLVLGLGPLPEESLVEAAETLQHNILGLSIEETGSMQILSSRQTQASAALGPVLDQDPDASEDCPLLSKIEVVQTPEVNIGIRRVSTAPAYIQRRRPPEILTPHFIWFPTPARCTLTERLNHHARGQTRPIKSCFARPSQSEPPSPGWRSPVPISRTSSGLSLRNVDTRSLPVRRVVPPINLWRLERKHKMPSNITSSRNRKDLSPDHFSTKGRLAEAATTRTDVHVYPALPLNGTNRTKRRSHSQLNGPKPTIQIVESNNGIYEIVWDDLVVEDQFANDSYARRSGGLPTLPQPSQHFNLERVSTKLAAWSWMKGIREGKFSGVAPPSPEFYVYPDQSSPHFAIAIDEREDLYVSPPPNSERTSQHSTRYHSRGSTPGRPSTPAPIPFSSSGSITSSHSHKSEQLLDAARANPTASLTEISEGDIVIRDRNGPRFGKARRSWTAPRKFSNIAEHEMHFKSHRDSVELSWKRIASAAELADSHTRHDSFTLQGDSHLSKPLQGSEPEDPGRKVQVHFTNPAPSVHHTSPISNGR